MEAPAYDALIDRVRRRTPHRTARSRIWMRCLMPRCLRLGIRRILPLMLMTALSGCALFNTPPEYRGNALTAAELKQLTPGVSTKSDARALLGSPTLHETFNDDDWLYVSEITKRRIAQTQGVVKQHVVVLDFNSQGVLKDIKQFDRNDAVFVAMAGGHTKAPGGSASFLRQLVGGVGSYSPGLGAGQGGGGSSGSVSGF